MYTYSYCSNFAAVVCAIAIIIIETILRITVSAMSATFDEYVNVKRARRSLVGALATNKFTQFWHSHVQ